MEISIFLKIGEKKKKKVYTLQVEQRVKKMLELGLIEEVEGRLKKELKKGWPLLQSVGIEKP